MAYSLRVKRWRNDDEPQSATARRNESTRTSPDSSVKELNQYKPVTSHRIQLTGSRMNAVHLRLMVTVVLDTMLAREMKVTLSKSPVPSQCLKFSLELDLNRRPEVLQLDFLRWRASGTKRSKVAVSASPLFAPVKRYLPVRWEDAT